MLHNRKTCCRPLACCFAPALVVLLFAGTGARAQVPTLPAETATTKQGAVQAQPGATAPVGAAAPAEVSQEPPTEAELLIDSAAKAIAKLKSVAADLVESVQMLNLTYSIKGRYMMAPDWRVYLRLTVSGLPDASGTTLQVCDGETLWDYQHVLNNQSYRRLTIKPILERLNSPDLDPRSKSLASTQMGLVGPEPLLINLRKTLKFDQKPEEGVLDGRKVWILHGTWRTRQGLVGPDSRPVNAVAMLPPYIPATATLYLGKDEHLWPYKLILIGQKPSPLFDSRRVGPDGKVIGSKSSIEQVIPSRIELVYSDVKLNVAIKTEEFAFQPPPSAPVDDSTEAYVKLLDQAIQVEIQRKKNEAAKTEGPVIDQTIDVPSPEDAVKAPR
jgi:outer membrane lipoprotein-sorting protein